MAKPTHRPSPAPKITWFVFGGQKAKSHCLSGRSWPSTIRSASPEMMKKASASVSQWYIEFGSPGSRRKRLTPSIGEKLSASHSSGPVNEIPCRREKDVRQLLTIGIAAEGSDGL